MKTTVMLTLRLQIPVNETHQVEIFQRGCYLSSVEPCVIFQNALPRSSLQRCNDCQYRFTDVHSINIPRKNSPPLQYSIQRYR